MLCGRFCTTATLTEALASSNANPHPAQKFPERAAPQVGQKFII
jgi:hypothetical protein